MNPNSATTPETPYEAWRRFTLLDLMILFTGHGAAMGMIKWYELIDYEPRGIDGIWILIRGLFLGYMFVFVGAIFSVPIIIAVQFLSRKRQMNLAGGEILGVATVIYWMLAFLLIILFPYGFVGQEVCVGISAIGFLILFGCLKGSLSTKPCLWLSIYGSAIFSSSIFLLAFILVMEKFFSVSPNNLFR
jgi:hypothetical protein